MPGVFQIKRLSPAAVFFIFCDKLLHFHLPNPKKNCILNLIETVGESSVSSGCWGEDSNCELAGAAHFHVASPAY
jgi:hypothetical protein